MTALIIVMSLSALSTLVILGGLIAAKRAAVPSFETNEIAFSSPNVNPVQEAYPSSLAPAFSH